MNLEIEKCEICGEKLKKWNLDKNNILLQCPNCEHILRNIEICKANSRKHAWGGNTFYDKIRNYFTYLNINKNIKNNFSYVFEFGFGGGFLLRKFLDSGKKIAGADKNSLEVKIDSKVLKKGDLFFGKGEDFQFPKDKYDLILGIHLIEHLDDPMTLFEKSYDSLKKGASVYFITPNGNSLGLKLFKSFWWNLEDPTHIRFFSEKSLKLALEKVGFKNIKINYPIWDSLTCEINSLLRFFSAKNKNGILAKKITKLINLFLLFPFLFLRIIFRKLCPSIVVIAKK